MLICGSSSTLPLLISKNLLQYPNLAAKYPLLPSTPNLNNTKYPQFHLSQGMTKQDFHNIMEGLHCHEPLANALFFIAGSNICLVEWVLLARQSPCN